MCCALKECFKCQNNIVWHTERTAVKAKNCFIHHMKWYILRFSYYQYTIRWLTSCVKFSRILNYALTEISGGLRQSAWALSFRIFFPVYKNFSISPLPWCYIIHAIFYCLTFVSSSFFIYSWRLKIWFRYNSQRNGILTAHRKVLYRWNETGINFSRVKLLIGEKN